MISQAIITYFSVHVIPKVIITYLGDVDFICDTKGNHSLYYKEQSDLLCDTKATQNAQGSGGKPKVNIT